MTAERHHSHLWDQASPEVQAAVDREMAKLRPAEDLDPEHCRRLAALLGFTSGGDRDG